jgi:hypothetical protein
MLPVVAVIRKTKLVTDLQASAACHAIQQQVSLHFAPIWRGCDALVVFCADGNVPDGAWPVFLVDTCDEQDALGYHFDQTIPSGIVGVKTSTDDGASWSSVLSHEILELIADPYADACRGAGPEFYSLEVCDPVEGQPYQIGGVDVERFILPNWFTPGSKGPWDFAPPGDKALLSGPLSLAPGGYMSMWDGSSWTQRNAEHTKNFRRTPHPASRRGRRHARIKGLAAR